MSRQIRRRRVVGLSMALLLVSMATIAHETDQYTARQAELADSTELLNREFNRMLSDIADDWLGGPNERLFAKRVFLTMGGWQFIDKYERWARETPEVQMLEMPRQDSIYRGGPFWSTRVIFFFGLGPVLQVDDQLVGTDKISHFLSQGWKYYRRSLRGKAEEQVVGIGQRNESGIFGYATTGVFSNADLVANYEGYLFYRSLFEGNVIPGKPALIEWLGVGARLRHEFDWRDHVNAYWDEALNPSLFDGLLRRRVTDHLAELCAHYFESPESYVAPDDAELAERYAILGLRDASQNRMDVLCEAETQQAQVTGTTTTAQP